jgi:hypothetical protein
MKQIIFFLLFLGVSLQLLAQDDEPVIGGTRWGIKSGPSLGFQGQGNMLLRYHGAVFIEGGGSETNPLYAELGYHARGFANRYQYQQNPQNPSLNLKTFAVKTIFHNVSLSLGMKKKGDYRENIKYFYSFAMRGELTVGSNLPYLDQVNPQNNQNTNFNSYFSNNIRPFNWGMDIGGGFEKPLSELLTGFIQFTLSPDLSYQYRVGSISPTGGAGGVSGHRNLSMELSVGVRFWHKVIYE